MTTAATAAFNWEGGPSAVGQAPACLEGRGASQFVLIELGRSANTDRRLIEKLAEIDPDVRVTRLGGPADIEMAAQAIRRQMERRFAAPHDNLAVADAPGQPVGEAPLKSLERLEWEHIQRMLAEHGGNRSAAAKALKINRRTLQRKLARPGPAE